MATWYVDKHASGAGDGTSRADAWTQLDSITGVSAGDTVRLIEEAREQGRVAFSLGLALDDETVDHLHIDGTGSATEARKPRVIAVYRQGLSQEQRLRSARNALISRR